jgi:ribosomal protein L24E
VHQSARRGLAALASLLTVATLAAPARAATYRADAASSITDAKGDVTTEARPDQLVNEARADVTAASAEYRPGEIALTLNVAQPTDPRTDPNWKDGASFALWGIDTSGDQNADYLISLVNVQGVLISGVVGADDIETVKCFGSGTFDGTTYGAVIASSCLGNPASFNWGGGMAYTPNPGTLNAPLAVDSAPDGDAMAGPVTAPAAIDPGAGGYWLVGRDGGVFSFNSPFSGSTGAIKLNQPIVGMTADPDHKGYWFVASDGGVFGFDAPFLGSTGNLKLNQPIVGMAPTPTGQGYWLVASDGGIFSFGDAKFLGSTGAIKLNRPIVGMASDGTGQGYWMVAADGGVFAFGSALPLGSALGSSFPVVGITAAKDGRGYSIVRADGTVVNKGSAPPAGSLVGHTLTLPIVGVAATI